MDRQNRYKILIAVGYLLAALFIVTGSTAFLATENSYFIKSELLGIIGRLCQIFFLPMFIVTTMIALKVKVFPTKLYVSIIIIAISLVIVIFKLINFAIEIISVAISG
jgi:hypothetical protein